MQPLGDRPAGSAQDGCGSPCRPALGSGSGRDRPAGSTGCRRRVGRRQPGRFLELPLSRPERDVDPTRPASTCRSAPSRIGAASPPRRMFPGASTVATVSRPAMTGLRPSGTDPIGSRIGKTARAHRMLTLGRTPPIRIRAGPLRRRGSRRVAEGRPDPVLETGSEPGFGRRHRPRAPVLADRHEGEGRLGHLHGDLARPFAPPDLDLDA